MSEAPIRALLLAAGWGTRLGPLARDRPKPLLPLGGGTPLDVAVDRADAVAAVTGIDIWTNERFRPAFEAWARTRRTRATLRVLGNGTRTLESRLGAIGDVAAYLEREGAAHGLLVIAADNVFDMDLDPLAEVAREEVAVVVHDVGSPAAAARYASVVQDDEGRIVRLVEKDPDPPGNLAATALYGIPESALADVARYLRDGGTPDTLGSLLEWWVPRRPVLGLPLPGRWIDVGSHEELDRARALFGTG